MENVNTTSKESKSVTRGVCHTKNISHLMNAVAKIGEHINRTLKEDIEDVHATKNNKNTRCKILKRTREIEHLRKSTGLRLPHSNVNRLSKMSKAPAPM